MKTRHSSLYRSVGAFCPTITIAAWFLLSEIGARSARFEEPKVIRKPFWISVLCIMPHMTVVKLQSEAIPPCHSYISSTGNHCPRNRNLRSEKAFLKHQSKFCGCSIHHHVPCQRSNWSCLAGLNDARFCTLALFFHILACHAFLKQLAGDADGMTSGLAWVSAASCSYLGIATTSKKTMSTQES